MRASNLVVFTGVVLIILLAIYGVRTAVDTHNNMEQQKVELQNTKTKLQNNENQLKKANQLNDTNKQQIQQLENDKKDLNGKLEAKIAEKAQLALQEQQRTEKLAAAKVGTTLSSSSRFLGNGWWCTDWVYSKRADIRNYGSAGYNWISKAQAEGKATGSTPAPGAVAVMAGHVAYVQSVNADGSYFITEMGWNYQAGNYNERTVSPGTFGGFIYA